MKTTERLFSSNIEISNQFSYYLDIIINIINNKGKRFN